MALFSGGADGSYQVPSAASAATPSLLSCMGLLLIRPALAAAQTPPTIGPGSLDSASGSSELVPDVGDRPSTTTATVLQ